MLGLQMLRTDANRNLTRGSPRDLERSEYNAFPLVVSQEIQKCGGDLDQPISSC
jgi:hypothetical protein